MTLKKNIWIALVALVLPLYGSTMEKHKEIHHFWFGNLNPSGSWDESVPSKWYSGGEELDHYLREHYATDIEKALNGEYDHWCAMPRGRLALIILLDQFSRNIYRGSPRAFAADEKALALSQEAIANQEDEKLHPIERKFLYMPFQHAEDISVQRESLTIYSRLVAAAPESKRAFFEGVHKYAKIHCDLIAEFGRFPHRNAILGRESTQKEREYLEKGGMTFGQK